MTIRMVLVPETAVKDLKTIPSVSCTNCKHYYLAAQLCKAADVPVYNPPPDFFCSHWEPRK